MLQDDISSHGSCPYFGPTGLTRVPKARSSLVRFTMPPSAFQAESPSQGLSSCRCRQHTPAACSCSWVSTGPRSASSSEVSYVMLMVWRSASLHVSSAAGPLCDWSLCVRGLLWPCSTRGTHKHPAAPINSNMSHVPEGARAAISCYAGEALQDHCDLPSQKRADVFVHTVQAAAVPCDLQ